MSNVEGRVGRGRLELPSPASCRLAVRLSLVLCRRLLLESVPLRLLPFVHASSVDPVLVPRLSFVRKYCWDVSGLSSSSFVKDVIGVPLASIVLHRRVVVVIVSSSLFRQSIGRYMRSLRAIRLGKSRVIISLPLCYPVPSLSNATLAATCSSILGARRRWSSSCKKICFFPQPFFSVL